MASANEIWLKVKGVFVDKISTGVKAAMGKLKQATGPINGMLGGITGMMGSLGGATGQVTRAVGGLVSGLSALGAVGGVLAGIQIACGWIIDRANKAAEAMKALANEHLTRMHERLARIKATEIEKLDNAISKAADDAQRAAAAFDAMANAYLKVARAKDQTAAAGDEAIAARLALEKQNAISAAPDSGAAAVIGAGYDVRIAEGRLSAVRERQAAAVEMAAKQATDDAKRAAAADKAVRDAAAALALARRKRAEAENMEETAPDFLRARERSVRTAAKALEAARLRQVSAQAQAESSSEAYRAAQLRQSAAMDSATAAVVAARRAEADIVKGRQDAEAAAVERLRLEAERRAAAERAATEARRKEVETLKGSIAESEKSRVFFEGAQSRAAQELANAWHLYRDKAAMQAVMDEEAAQKAAEQSWARDFDSLKSRRRDWRTAENLNVDDRATREVALAKERKEQAEKSLREIAENTRATREKLESLLTMKGGE